MSYDVTFVYPGTEDIIEFDEPHHLIGGTYRLGGTPKAWLNITYNYSKHYRDIWNMSLNDMHGWTIEQTKPYIEQGIRELGITRSDNYWEATSGNAGAALADLLILMVRCPSDAQMLVR